VHCLSDSWSLCLRLPSCLLVLLLVCEYGSGIVLHCMSVGWSHCLSVLSGCFCCVRLCLVLLCSGSQSHVVSFCMSCCLACHVLCGCRCSVVVLLTCFSSWLPVPLLFPASSFLLAFYILFLFLLTYMVFLLYYAREASD